MSTTFLLPLLGFATALIISAYSIPVIIKVAFIRKIYDKPGGRKTHKGYVPNLGGIAIFAGFTLSFVCWTNFSDSVYLQYLILGLIILHFIGVKDDIVPLTPYKKLIGQLLAAAILVVPGKFRINDLHGILGLYQISAPCSIGLSIFAVVLLINSFNLIDGIDGLAGGISLLISLIFSYIFWIVGMNNALIASLALTGALVSFLFYNKQPARIFMGDAGSMCIGYLMAAFSFLFMKANSEVQNNLFHHNPAVLIAFFIVPLFDTFRVFTIRILHKKSPFEADSNHIHHKLQLLGLSHGKIALTLTAVNASFIGFAYLLSNVSPTWLIISCFMMCCLLTTILYYTIGQQKGSAQNPRPLPEFKIIHAIELSTLPPRKRKPIEVSKTELSEISSN